MTRPLAMQAGTCAVPTRRLMQLPLCATSKQGSNLIKSIVLSIVADPDPIRSRIRRIHMFLGLLDPDPDPLVRGVDPDPAPDPGPAITKQK